MEQKEHTTIGEIAVVLSIPARTAYQRAASQQWRYTEEAVRGGRRRLYRIAELPDALRIKVLEHRITQSLQISPAAAITPSATVFPGGAPSRAAGVLSSNAASEVLPPPTENRNTEDLTERERENGKARVALLDQLYQWIDQVGTDRAIGRLVETAKKKELTPELQALVTVANAHGRKREGLSRASLLRWKKADDRNATWAQRVSRQAAKPGKRISYELPEDVAAVLAKYRQPNKPSLNWCAKEVAKQLGVSWVALEHRARYFMKKVPRPVFYQGRHTGAALVALKPFQRRDFLSLKPNDVWIGDGHGAKLRVAHPITGSPFVPEVTVIMDVSDRYVVGWSVALSENCIAVSDALRHAMSQHGVPLVYYSDNGGGQTNKMFDAPLTGTFNALGIYHATGRPRHPQARGVIERFWQTVLITLARRFETFQGHGADRETVRKVASDINKALLAAKKGNVTVLPKKLPTWSQFLEALEEALSEYNERHEHRSLPKLDGARHATPAEYRASRLQPDKIHKPQPDELAMMFMPSVTRRAVRGEVRLFNGIYFHQDLMLVDGEDLVACYDIHDPNYVLVKRPSGEFIAKAILGGNRGDYMPKPLIERLADQRAQRRAARLETQLAEVTAEHRGLVVPAAIEVPEADLIALERDMSRRAARTVLAVPERYSTAYAWYLELAQRTADGQPLPECVAHLKGWFENFPNTTDFRMGKEHFSVEFPDDDIKGHVKDLVAAIEQSDEAACEVRAA